MKASQVMSVLDISRVTLSKYVTTGVLKTSRTTEGGQYTYDSESVYQLLSKDIRKAVVCLDQNQDTSKIDEINNYIQSNHLVVLKSLVLTNSFANKKELIDLITSYRLSHIIVFYADTIARSGIEEWQYLFSKYGCQLIILSELN